MTPDAGRSWSLATCLLATGVGWSLGICANAADPDAARSWSVEEVFAAWQAEVPDAAPRQIVWRHDSTGPFQFSRFEAEWAGGDLVESASPETTLSLDGDRLRLTSRGYLPLEHSEIVGPLRQQVPLLVREHFPERFEENWQYQRSHFFEAADGEIRPIRPFVRTFDGEHLKDLWPSIEGSYPRGTIYGAPENPTAWMQFSRPAEATERLLWEDFLAALLALQPGHPRLLDPNPAHWKITGQEHLGDVQCLVVERFAEAAEQPESTLYVAPKQGMRIQRYRDHSMAAPLLIDIAHTTPTSPTRPRGEVGGWTIIEPPPPGFAIQSILWSKVVSDGVASPLAGSDVRIDFPEGTWVIERAKRLQYLVRPDSSRRVITSAELLWLPTYQELRDSESGQVSRLIEAKLSRAVWVWQALAMSVTALAGGILWWKRHAASARNGSGLSPVPATPPRMHPH